MNTNEVTRMNRAQYQDDLDHKMKVYDEVKATLSLCRTMIKAIDPTSDNEIHARGQLISYLELAGSYSNMAGCDVLIEKRELTK